MNVRGKTCKKRKYVCSNWAQNTNECFTTWNVNISLELPNDYILTRDIEACFIDTSYNHRKIK